mgnify:CR=1 FL=1
MLFYSPLVGKQIKIHPFKKKENKKISHPLTIFFDDELTMQLLFIQITPNKIRGL